MTDPKSPAFPVPGFGSHGLTKREYIAAAVMAGFAGDYMHPEAAMLAVRYADALIAELNKTKPAEESNP